MFIHIYGSCPLDSRITWSVLLSVDSRMALQSQSGFAELETGGRLEGHCCDRTRNSPVAMIVDCKLLCLSLFCPVMHLLYV